jgi:general nucleoside transport system ATP-binding protein
MPYAYVASVRLAFSGAAASTRHIHLFTFARTQLRQMTPEPSRDQRTPLAELRNIVKVFPGVRANDGVSFSILPGEVHGLLGENGAGKSTLMSVLYGLYQPEEGEILRNGVQVTIANPRAALQAGIAIVQQHFALVPTMTVTENVILGNEPSRILRRTALSTKVAELSQRYRLDLDPSAFISTLSIGQRQRVEILKCLYRDPEVVIFDEPSTVLTPQEIEDLYGIIRTLTAENRGVVLITHKLDELMAITDRVTVLRHGKSTGTVVTSEVDGQALARMMVGRDVKLRATAALVGLKTAPTLEESVAIARRKALHDGGAVPVLTLSDVGLNVEGVDRLKHLTLTVMPGEIVGVAGVEGNGQRELVDLLSGTALATSGTITVSGTDFTKKGPIAFGAAGVRIVTEDRHATGCVLDMTVGENLLLDRIGSAPFSRRGVISKSATELAARKLIADYRVKTPGPYVQIRTLSGGNQQRAILARELSREVKVLVAAQPTRGLDVGAIEEVTERVLAARDGGAAVLLISSDLAEIMSLADRIAVMYRGEFLAVIDRFGATTERIGELMAGLVTPADTSGDTGVIS